MSSDPKRFSPFIGIFFIPVFLFFINLIFLSPAVFAQIPSPSITPSCPQYSPPAPEWCLDGTILLGGTDSNGCQLPGKCSKSCNSVCERNGDCSSGYCYQPPFSCPPGLDCPQVMPQKICRNSSCPGDLTCSDTCSSACSQEGSPCGVGFAGPSHPLGTCCPGLNCVESNMPDAGGTCQGGSPPSPPPPIDCPTHQFGDANCDGIINDADYRIWEWESQFPDLPYKRADFYSDGVEDLIDFEIWRRNSQGSDICTNADKTASMTYDEAKSIAENSICTSEGIIRDEGREYCNNNTGTWWLPFSSLSNSKPGCSPTCVVDINTKQADINWSCTGVITPTPSQCCSQSQIGNGYQCIVNCGPPVVREGDPPPGFSCLSPADISSRNQYGCPI